MGPALDGTDRDGGGHLAPEEIGATRSSPDADARDDGLDLPKLAAALFAQADADDSGHPKPEERRAPRSSAMAGADTPGL